MSSFYRVLRPWRYDKARHELKYSPYGGIVFRLEDADEHQYWVTASRCGFNTRFSMDVASQICDVRADQIRKNDPCSTNGSFTHQPWDIMRPLLLKWFADYKPLDDTAVELYRAHEFNRIARVGYHIELKNKHQLSLMRVAEEALQGEQIKGMYASIDRLKG